MKTDANEPLIPNEKYGNIGGLGITKLEYFAAAALTGLRSNPAYVNNANIGAIAVNDALNLIHELNNFYVQDEILANAAPDENEPVDFDEDDLPW